MTDKQLVRVARSFRRGLLGKDPVRGMCAAVSMPLAGLLSAYGVKAQLAIVDWKSQPDGWMNHVFLRLEDDRILDPTADQFGLPPVYLGPVPAQYLLWQQPPATE